MKTHLLAAFVAVCTIAPFAAHAQYIDGLPTASSVASTDLIPVCQGGTAGHPGTCTTRSATAAQLAGGSSTSPGGSSGQVQYNNSGAFGGLSNAQLTADINVFSSSLPGAAPASGGGTTTFLRADGAWAAPSGSGSGTVNSVSVTTANGFAGTVANPTTTPAITLSVPVSGILKSNGTAVSAATAGTDYLTPTGSGAGLTGLTYGHLPALSANQVLGALTATTPAGLSVPSCSGASNALIWTSGTGFGCNTISGGGGSNTLTRATHTAAYTTVVGDVATVQNLTGTFTYTFTAPATLGNGWWQYVENNGSGTITLTPASGTIDGTASYPMYAGEVRLVQTDGTNFYTTLIQPFTVSLLSTTTISVPPGYSWFQGFIWGGGGGGFSGSSTGASGGGGGASLPFDAAAAGLWARGSSVTCLVGAGGAAGAAGGNTTLAGLSGYGGAGSGGNNAGGGGGGVQGAGSGTTGGVPLGGTAATGTENSTFGGGSGASTGTFFAGSSVYGGGGGGFSSSSGAGGNSIYGGAGGGGASSSSTQGAGGTSSFGGAGGAAVASGTPNAGAQPGGGGGGNYNGTGGAGGAGECLIRGII